MITGINRGKLDPAVQEEFDHMTMALRPLLSQLFDENGVAVDTSDTTAAVKVGTIVLWPGAVPRGYLACNGQAVSRAFYVTVFQLIGVTYGAGNGSTTFNLPNLPPVAGVSYVMRMGN